MPDTELAGLAEVAHLIGVSKRSASRYTRQSDFPEPLARLAAGPIWDAAEVREWAIRRRPFRVGRPPKQSQD
jgi:predicted DNA-binding transcriptional regulator AlpA